MKVTQLLVALAISILAIAPDPPRAKAPFDAAQAEAHQTAWAKHLSTDVETTNSVGMKLRLIPQGEFLMGSPMDERGHGPETQHRVQLTRSFYLAAHEVTQEQYQKVMGENPSSYSPTGRNRNKVADLDTTKFPVDEVSWFDAVDFCNKLSEKEDLSQYYLREGDAVTILGGNGYRLPTEAEWEYACRAGTTTPFHFGSQCNGTRANVDGTWPYSGKRAKVGSIWPYEITEKGPYLERPTTVGSYPSNAFGLYDMHGNQWEWCQDWYAEYGDESVSDPTGPLHGKWRVVRGGSFYGPTHGKRSASRSNTLPDKRSASLSFRPARTYP